MQLSCNNASKVNLFTEEEEEEEDEEEVSQHSFHSLHVYSLLALKNKTSMAPTPPFLTLLLFQFLLFPPHPTIALSTSSDDLAALRSLKESLTDLPGSSFFSTWDFSSPDPKPCLSFSGLTCSPDDHRITILSLGDDSSIGPSLAGFLPGSLSSLTSLTQLLLSPGIVTGHIPYQLSLLRELRVLSLPHNHLTGPIPSSLASLPSLHCWVSTGAAEAKISKTCRRK